MPELAEVEYYRRKWPISRAPILEVLLHPRSRVFRNADTSLLQANLPGSCLEHSETHGKQMMFVFARDDHPEKAWVFIHLGMTGKLHTQGGDYTPARHDHLVLRQADQSLVFTDYRMFGAVQAKYSAEAPSIWTARSHSVLDKAFTVEHVRGALQRHARLPMKAMLLHQKWFPGIGNWMADEILFQSRIHPRTLAGSLGIEQSQTLWKVARAITKRALDTIGKDWSDPPAKWLFHVRWKAGGSCPVCHTLLERDTVGGRTTCWCAKCQAA